MKWIPAFPFLYHISRAQDNGRNGKLLRFGCPPTPLFACIYTLGSRDSSRNSTVVLGLEVNLPPIPRKFEGYVEDSRGKGIVALF